MCGSLSVAPKCLQLEKRNEMMGRIDRDGNKGQLIMVDRTVACLERFLVGVGLIYEYFEFQENKDRVQSMGIFD